MTFHTTFYAPDLVTAHEAAVRANWGWRPTWRNYLSIVLFDPTDWTPNQELMDRCPMYRAAVFFIVTAIREIVDWISDLGWGYDGPFDRSV